MRDDDRTDLYGGGGGSPFSDVLPGGCRISQIDIRSGQFIDGIRMCWVTASGEWVRGPWRGGTGGSPASFTLAPGEHIRDMQGRCGAYVDSLTFHTNFGNVHGPFGGSGGGDFRDNYGLVGLVDDRPVPEPQVTGFFGRSGIYLDDIGNFYFRQW